MVRLYPMLYFALLALVVPVVSAGQDGQLAKLSEVKIVVGDIRQEEKELGLNKDDIKNYVFVFLRSKLPQLTVKETVQPHIFISVNLKKRYIDGRFIGFHGGIHVDIVRPVKIIKTGGIMFATLWHKGGTLIGPADDGVGTTVRRFLDQLLTNFAADWNKDNP